MSVFFAVLGIVIAAISAACAILWAERADLAAGEDVDDDPPDGRAPW